MNPCDAFKRLDDGGTQDECLEAAPLDDQITLPSSPISAVARLSGKRDDGCVSSRLAGLQIVNGSMVTPDGRWITFDGGETFSLVPGYVPAPHREDVVDSSDIAHERDALTKLRTLSGVRRALEEAIGTSPDRSVALLYIDIDHFLAFNHRYGHRAGDDVLVEFANRLVEVVGGDGGLFRTGGEEFLAVLPNATVDAACAVAERVCERVRNAPFELHTGGSGLTTSIGVVCASGQDATWDALWGAADRALLESKRSGRNRWTLAT